MTTPINNCYIVTYELVPNQNTDGLYSQIRSYGIWGRITDNTWAIVTTDSAVNVRDALLTHLLPGSRLFVIKSGFESAWLNARCDGVWLKENL